MTFTILFVVPINANAMNECAVLLISLLEDDVPHHLFCEIIDEINAIVEISC